MGKKDQLIVALDMSDHQNALALVDRLAPAIDFFKIGLQLFTSAGPQVVKDLLQRDCRVFLDLKLHDIPNTVGQAAVQAGRMGVHMLTIHALGGEEMMRWARRAVDEGARREGWKPPQLLGVTVLTSMLPEDLHAIGIRMSLDAAVSTLAGQARSAGMDGVVASPRELKLLRQAGLGDMVFVIPGIRPPGGGRHDQARTATPQDAIRDGADYLVVGRPITAAPDPLAAALQIQREIVATEPS